MYAEPVPSSLRAVEEPAGPQDVAVIFAHNEPIGETTPIKDGEATAEAPAEAPLTPPQDKVEASQLSDVKTEKLALQ